MRDLLELEDVVLLPKDINNSFERSQMNFSIEDPNESIRDYSRTYPIMTAPLEVIIGSENWKFWIKEGIKPILPRTEPLQTRLQACKNIFACFSIGEVVDNFLRNKQMDRQNQFRICLESSNPHGVDYVNTAYDLKNMYGNQVILMGGRISMPPTYKLYMQAGFDYVRVGTGGSLSNNQETTGFHYPLASLLSDIMVIKKQNSNGNNTRFPFIIAEGGISNHADIIKCIALGADYVMLGQQLTEVLEANGPLYKTIRDAKTGNETLSEQSWETVSQLTDQDLYIGNYTRQYYGSVRPEDSYDSGATTWKWVEVKRRFRYWMSDLKDSFEQAFLLSNAQDWSTFKSQINYERRY